MQKENNQFVPQTPPSRKRTFSISDIYYTPTHKQSYKDTYYTILREEMVSRPVRSFLQKVGKAIDRIEWESTQKDLLLKAQQTQIDDLHQRKQKRQAIDCNETPANIETIHMARQRAAALPARRRATRVSATSMGTRDVSANDPQSAYMHVFSVDPNVVD